MRPVGIGYRRALELIEDAARRSYFDDRVTGWSGSVS